MGHTPVHELKEAAAQQMLITEKRLRELWERRASALREARASDAGTHPAQEAAQRRTGA